MTFNEIVESVKSLRSPAHGTPELAAGRYQHQEFAAFLEASVEGDVPIFISDNAMFLYGVIVPLERLRGEYQDDLLGWNFEVPSGYGYDYSWSGSAVTCELSSPLIETRSAILDGSDPVFFYRPFHGVDDAPRIEINQRLSHLMDLHSLPARDAWCKLDEVGAIIPAARYGWIGGGAIGDGICCTLRRQELDIVLHITKSCLVRVFDVTRGFGPGAGGSEQIVRNDRLEIVAKCSMFRDSGATHGSALRGFQILRCSRTPEEMSLVIAGREPREYASFIILDWKHGRVVEWPSMPERLGNYFTESELPFATSPAFFRPEVLTQYRGNPERYVIETRRVRCKGAWQVPYDINSEGLVHAYIGDLAHLPYQEQLRWQAFNVQPAGTISKRSYQADFVGNWDEEYDPLESLKNVLRSFPLQDQAGHRCPVWRLPDLPRTQDLDFLGYVVTDARKEWEDQVLALSRILVEGLNSRLIRSLAETLNCHEKGLGSIRQLDRVLGAVGIGTEVREGIISPLVELQRLRSSKVAHTGGEAPAHDLRAQFRDMLGRCDTGMRELAGLVRAGVFAISR